MQVMEKHLSFEDMEHFLEGTLGEEARAAVEKHISKCGECLGKMEALRTISETLDGWTARRHGEAYVRRNREAREEIVKTVSDHLELSELDLKRQDKAAAAGRPDAAPRAGDACPGEGFRLAAAPRRQGNTGRAWGVAVDETGNGALIDVAAWVGVEKKDRGELRIVAAEVEGVTQAGRTYEVTPPSKLLAEALSQRFRTVASLSALELDRRDVHVEIRNAKFLEQAGSLLLAVIVAVLKAALGVSGRGNAVYSAGVGMDGKLEGVGKIKEKAAWLSTAGNYEMVVSPGDRGEIDAVAGGARPDVVLSFETLDDVVAWLGPGVIVSAAEGRKGAEAGRGGGLARIPVLLLLSLPVCGILLLWHATGNLFAVTDLMLAWSLGHEGSDFFRYVQVAKYVLSTGLAVWLSAQTLSIILRVTGGKGVEIFVKLEKIRRHRPEQLLVFLFVLYVTLNAFLFVREFYIHPRNFDKYERVEYLVYDEEIGRFAGFVRRVPDYRYEYFRELAAGPSPEDHDKAVRIGLKMNVKAPSFQDTFEGVAALLMDRVDSSGYAREALCRYVEFEKCIRGRKNAAKIIARTLGPAMDLMERYGLRDMFCGNIALGGFIEQTLMRYGIKR